MLLLSGLPRSPEVINPSLFFKPRALVPLASAWLTVAPSRLSPSRVLALPEVSRRLPSCHRTLASCAPLPAGSTHMLCSSPVCGRESVFSKRQSVRRKKEEKEKGRKKNLN